MSNLINDAARANRVNPSLTAESKLKPEWATTAMQQDAPLASAALAAQSLFDANGEVTSGISVIGTGRIVTETTYASGEHIFVDLSENGSCCASVCPAGSTTGTQFPSVGSTGCSRELTPLYTAVLAMLCQKDSDALADLQKIADVAAQGAFDDAFKALVENLAAKVVDALDNGMVLLSMRGGNINILTATRMKSVIGNGSLLYGSAPTLFPQGAQPKGVLSSIEAAKKQYSAYSANRNWTEEEIKLIPVRPDDEVVMPEVLTFASLILATKDSKRPFQNFFWRGITGYGKSTGKQTYKNLMTADMLRYARALYNQLRDALQDVMEGDSRKGLLYGRKFVGSDAHRLDGKRFCNDKDPLDFPDMAICVLIDQSGSMCGIRMQSSKTAALLLHKVATNLGIPIMVCGHAARGSVHFNVYADFEQQTDNDKYRICGISTGGRNRDGMAITIAAELLSKRPESNKLLFVISDGQPNDADYGGEPAKNDIREIINAYRRKGVVTFGCAIGSDKEVVKDIYRKGFLDITELDAFPKLLCRLVVQNLDV